MKTAVGFGALNVDNIYKVENLLLEENSAAPIDVQAGGSAANTIIALAKLEIPSGFIGIVASDAFGQLLIAEFKRKKVDTSKIIIQKAESLLTSSGQVEAYVDKKGRRQLFIKPGVNNLLKFSDVDIEYLNKAEIAHFSSFVGDKQLEIQIKTVAKLSKEVKISFSPGSIYCERGIRSILPIIKRTHVLFLDRREIYKLTGKNFKKGCEELLRLDPHIVVVTLGRDGSYTATKNEKIFTRAKKVKAVDTTGAGDAFAAGFIFGLINNSNLQECAKLANIVASFCVKKIGARSGLPNRKELAYVVELPQ